MGKGRGISFHLGCRAPLSWIERQQLQNWGFMFLCVEVVSTIPFASSQSQMKSELAAVASEFGRLTRFLAEEQAGLERRLREMHEAQLGRAGAVASRLAEQAAQLSCLLAEAQERSQQGGLRLLQVSSAPFPVCSRAPCVCFVRHCFPNTCPWLPFLIGRNAQGFHLWRKISIIVECGVYVNIPNENKEDSVVEGGSQMRIEERLFDGDILKKMTKSYCENYFTGVENPIPGLMQDEMS